MASAAAIDSSYDVFLSFRGEDTGTNFTDHLYERLTRVGILTFRDKEEINRGEVVKSEIQRAIKESRASIIILSKNYATSTWCLDELVLILKQRKEYDRFVLPVFYHVDPSDVRKHKKTFAIEVKTSSRWTNQNVEQWKEALTEVSNLSGMVLDGSRHETEVLDEIVDSIYDKGCRKVLDLPINLTGLTTLDKVLKSINQPSYFAECLAICGMAGSGKTTLAKYIYNSICNSFKNVSFIEGIGHKCEESSDNLLRLQQQLLNDMLGSKDRRTATVSQATRLIKNALERESTLIVLDDIVSKDQFQSLLGTTLVKICKGKSKLIITTKVLNIDQWIRPLLWTCQKYEMKPLSDDDSHELLSRHAFRSRTPMEGFEGLARQAVSYCQGNPLALEVLGSSLAEYDSIESWESKLNLLEKEMDSGIQRVLFGSYHSLPQPSYKELFLHIACFFVGKDKDYVAKILEHDYSALSGIKSLSNRCLLSVSSNNKILMHRLLQEMGKNIVRQEELKFPEKRSRVWQSDDSYKILTNGKGSETVEGLVLDMEVLRKMEYSVKSSNLKTKALRKLKNLKLLHLNDVSFDDDGSYKKVSTDLIWLCWHHFHQKIIPSDLPMGKLVAIDLSYSKLEIFEPPMVLKTLKILNLKDSHNLYEILNINRVPNLETLILWNCQSLVSICVTIVELRSLELLHMTGCENLWREEQTNLLLEGQEASASTSSSGGGANLPFPPSLHRLFLNDCNLGLTGSFTLELSDQLSLEYLNLCSGQFEYLPDYNHLKNLRVLDLSCCSSLKQLQCLPSTLAELYVHYCTSLERITFESHGFTLQEFGYEGCINLCEVEGFFKLVPIAKLEEKELGHMKWLKDYQNRDVPLIGDEELTKGRSTCVQMLYEFGIMSTSLPDIKDTNMMSNYRSVTSSLSFIVPPYPKNRRLKGLNVTFKYTLLDSASLWFCKITTNKGVELIYNPKVFGNPNSSTFGKWLSYWPIGNILNTEDKVNVSLVFISGYVSVHECGVTLVYDDDKVVEETFGSNKVWAEILGGDLSRFQLSTKAYYLCRRNFFNLLRVPGQTLEWFRNLVGNTFDTNEVRGWRKTGRPTQLYQSSFTELKTVGCIINGSESDENYKIEEMPRSAVDTLHDTELEEAILSSLPNLDRQKASQTGESSIDIKTSADSYKGKDKA